MKVPEAAVYLLIFVCSSDFICMGIISYRYPPLASGFSFVVRSIFTFYGVRVRREVIGPYH